MAVKDGLFQEGEDEEAASLIRATEDLLKADQ
jgi:hypothetical protein